MAQRSVADKQAGWCFLWLPSFLADALPGTTSHLLLGFQKHQAPADWARTSPSALQCRALPLGACMASGLSVPLSAAGGTGNDWVSVQLGELPKEAPLVRTRVWTQASLREAEPQPWTQGWSWAPTADCLGVPACLWPKTMVTGLCLSAKRLLGALTGLVSSATLLRPVSRQPAGPTGHLSLCRPV